jgi:hypothetical protein
MHICHGQPRPGHLVRPVPITLAGSVPGHDIIDSMPIDQSPSQLLWDGPRAAAASIGPEQVSAP